MSLVLAPSLLEGFMGLQKAEQNRVQNALNKLRQDPRDSGLSLERINNGALWSARASRELRLILHQAEGGVWIALHAGHHDAAYEWANRRRIEIAPDGLVIVVEAPPENRGVGNGEVGSREESTPAVLLFTSHDDSYLQSLGVPESWLPWLRKVRDCDELLEGVAQLPVEVADRLLMLADGHLPAPPAPPENKPQNLITPVLPPDRFVTVRDEGELSRLLNEPMARWMAFLHPSQERLAKGSFNGPLKITGAAGTGKSVVALHRARHLARSGKRVLLTSYVTTLCDNLALHAEKLCSPEELGRITIQNLHSVASDILQRAGENFEADEPRAEAIVVACRPEDHALSPAAWLLEWRAIVEGQEIESWDEYRRASRAGRGTPLSVRARQSAWQGFEHAKKQLEKQGLETWPGLCRRARRVLQSGREASSWDCVLVDEFQDLRLPELRLVAALANLQNNNLQNASTPDALTLLGDAGQRIYAGRFPLSAAGIEVRGRSKILRVNYRTTEQIRRFAEALATHQSDREPDAEEEYSQAENPIRDRSILGGPQPRMRGFGDMKEQATWIAQEIEACRARGVDFHDIAVFARSGKSLDELQTHLQNAGVPIVRLSGAVMPTDDGVVLCTMHRSKGLEFKIVFVADCNANTLPPPSALQKAGDDAEREEISARERHLLYVAMTRARDALFVSWRGQACGFLRGIANGE